jgi:nicotinamidase/pyrazinamidase
MSEPGRDALLIVDVQNDFCAGGALAVPDGDAVVLLINRAAREVAALGGLVFASRDWHPRQTRHFVTHGGPWPVHCVSGTAGAQFHPGLDLPEGTMIVTKGDNAEDHGYSAFDGHLADGRGFRETLADLSVTRLFVAGLATDYCVRHSALDGRQAGLDVVLLVDAVRGVDVHAGDSQKAIREMADAGVRLGSSTDLGTR